MLKSLQTKCAKGDLILSMKKVRQTMKHSYRGCEVRRDFVYKLYRGFTTSEDMLGTPRSRFYTFFYPFALTDVDCYVLSNAADYRGHVSNTEGGLTCQKWTSQSPNNHTYTPANYPNDGLGDHNYCRNPGGGEPRVWCYTTDSITKWDYCNIPNPQQSCIGR